MRRVLLLIAMGIFLAACDSSPAKPKVAGIALAPAASPEQSERKQEEIQLLQQRAYRVLAEGKLLASCRSNASGHAFEQAICREQQRRSVDFLATVNSNYFKRSTVLSRSDDQANPWRWNVAGETCWSADCTQAQQLRTSAKRCGAPVLNALRRMCGSDEGFW